ncbi:MAG: extracellular solute-binding protein [Firmicutes bacterium]|jgi:ABC-type glycerol-3-phosphate transport system substrate-binding protein|nr:extracellular solute-binding protein [Bacillota bacterium]
MVRMREICAVVLSVVLAAASLAGAATTKVVHVMADHGEPFLEFLNERARAFEAKYPDVEVEVFAQQTDYTTKVQLLIAAGTQVDVLDSTHSFMAFSFTDSLADLMPYVKAEKINLDRDMLPFAQLVLMKDGKLYGIPSQLYGVVASYNRTYFDEIGVTPLRKLGEEWTWDWLRNNGGRLLKDIDGDGILETGAVTFSASFINVSPTIHQAGGSMFDSYIHPRRVNMMHPAVRTGLGFYVELTQRGWVGSQSFFTKRGNAINFYATGAHSSNFTPDGDLFEAVVQPKGPVRRGGHTMFGPFHVPAASNHQEWAFRWIAFLGMNEESQVKMMEATGRIPAHPPTLRKIGNYLGYAEPHVRDYLLQVTEASMHADMYPHTLTQAEGAIRSFFDAAFRQVLNGMQPLETFLETMQTQIQIELDKLWAN